MGNWKFTNSHKTNELYFWNTWEICNFIYWNCKYLRIFFFIVRFLRGLRIISIECDIVCNFLLLRNWIFLFLNVSRNIELEFFDCDEDPSTYNDDFGRGISIRTFFSWLGNGWILLTCWPLKMKRKKKW